MWLKLRDIDGVVHYHQAVTAEVKALIPMGQSVDIMTEREVEEAMRVLQLESKCFTRKELYHAINVKYSVILQRDEDLQRSRSEANAALRLLREFHLGRIMCIYPGCSGS